MGGETSSYPFSPAREPFDRQGNKAGMRGILTVAKRLRTGAFGAQRNAASPLHGSPFSAVSPTWGRDDVSDFWSQEEDGLEWGTTLYSPTSLPPGSGSRRSPGRNFSYPFSPTREKVRMRGHVHVAGDICSWILQDSRPRFPLSFHPPPPGGRRFSLVSQTPGAIPYPVLLPQLSHQSALRLGKPEIIRIFHGAKPP